MDVDHPRACRYCRLDGLSYGVRDVVKLQVEEDARALVRQATNERGALQCEKTAADLDAIHEAVQRRCELDCASARLDVERKVARMTVFFADSRRPTLALRRNPARSRGSGSAFAEASCVK